jgi:hypothetical protein
MYFSSLILINYSSKIKHMKKITITLFAMLIGLFVFAQSNSTLDVGPKGPKMNSSKGTWTLQINHPFTRSASAGCETDGTNYYVTQWKSNLIWKVSMTGVVLDSFSIPGVTGLRDLAYDGTYFYGGTSGSAIYKMNFASTPPSLVSTIASPNVTVRNICYDASANGGAGAFWVGNWSTDFSLVSRSGTVLATIPAATHGLKSTYGTAYDTISAGGPYIWAISSGNPANATIFQVKVSTGAQTGLTHDVSSDYPGATSGGGMWIQPNLVTGTVTLGGLVQGTAIFGYDLATTAMDTFDLAMETLNIGNLSPIGQNTDIKGTILNNGLATITSFDLNYSVDSGNTVTQNVTGVSIATAASYNFTHSTPWVTTAGSHNIKVWISNPNSHVDQNPANDTLTKQTVGYDPSTAVQRMPLYETFTSSTCGPCVSGNTNMDALFAANPNKWVCVKYQMSWPGSGDPYYTAEGGIRRQFYGVNSVPRQEIDGGYDGNSSSVTQADFDAAYAIPAFMGITADMVLGGHMVTVNYTIDPKIDFPANAKLYIAIVEKKTYNNTGSNGETEFHWVMKKMLPNGSGSTIGPLTANTTVTNSVSYAFNGPYRLPNNAGDPIDHTKENSVEDFNNLIAVVWVQNPTTKEVYQSALSSFTIGMDKAERDNLIKSVYPNPAQNQVNIDLNMEQSENVDVSIFNTLGQIVINKQFGSLNGANTLKINLGNLSQGIYFVKIQVGNKIYTKPLTVK